MKLKTNSLSENSYILTGDIDIPYDYNALWELHPLIKPKVFVHGAYRETPRFSQSYGHSYTFSGVTNKALPIPEILKPFLDWANETIGKQFKCQFNTLFLNWYPDGNHYIGKHKDD